MLTDERGKHQTERNLDAVKTTTHRQPDLAGPGLAWPAWLTAAAAALIKLQGNRPALHCKVWLRVDFTRIVHVTLARMSKTDATNVPGQMHLVPIVLILQTGRQ